MTTTKQALGPNQSAWLAELRSGKYPQGRGSLCTLDEGSGDVHGYCCLGVGCRIFLGDGVDEIGCVTWGNCAATAPQAIQDKLALRSNTGSHRDDGEIGKHSLTDLNDYEHKTFAQIADIVEADPGAYFTEPR